MKKNVAFTFISFAVLKWHECLSFQLPFELTVDIPVQLHLELEVNGKSKGKRYRWNPPWAWIYTEISSLLISLGGQLKQKKSVVMFLFCLLHGYRGKSCFKTYYVPKGNKLRSCDYSASYCGIHRKYIHCPKYTLFFSVTQFRFNFGFQWLLYSRPTLQPYLPINIVLTCWSTSWHLNIVLFSRHSSLNQINREAS